jgi:RNA polymerase sigma-70 factor (ECF subfamily)
VTEFIDDELMSATFMYCLRRLGSTADAEDLAQDIMCEALAGLKKSSHIENLDAWYWTLARNRLCVYLRKKKYNAAPIEEFGGIIAPDTSPCDAIIGAEDNARLNAALSRLSAIHRKVIVAFYLRGESIAQIARRLNVPEGTVKRRLHDARNDARKGFDEMEKTGRSAFAPADLDLSGGYGVPVYWDKISDTMTKQIFVVCREKAHTVREIADEIGVAPAYFEDKLKYLVENKFIKETQPGRYLTDFIIIPRQAKYDFVYESSVIFENIGAELTDTIASVMDRIRSLGFYGCDFEFSYLLWILYVCAASALSNEMLDAYRKKWDVPSGNGKPYRIDGSVQMPDETIKYRKTKKVSWSNLHKNFTTSDYREVCHANLYEYEPFPDRDNIITEQNADPVMKIFDNPAFRLTPVQEEMAAELIGKGYIRRDGSGLHLTMPVMTYGQKSVIEQMLVEPVKPLAEKYLEPMSKLLERVILPHIREDLLEEYVNWKVSVSFYPIGNVFYYGMYEGKTLMMPEDFRSTAAGIALYYRK